MKVCLAHKEDNMFHRFSLTLQTMLGITLVTLLLLGAVIACAVPSPTATPVPISTHEPTAAPLKPTSTPTVAPTATHTAKPAPEPTDTPEPTTTPTETPPPPTPTPETPITSAEYQLTFEATWSSSTHPTDFPSNPHFSGLIGATHSLRARLWEEGGLASPGIKNMAETGSKSPLDSEIDSLIDEGSACTKISGAGINPSPGKVSVTLTVSQDCPLVSVVTMIAPSPDWFVGVSGLGLYENGEWVSQKVVELIPYDAGTDSGASYNSANLATDNPEPISKIEVTPFLVNDSVPPLGTFTFTRLQD
jgi:hypothetical protein